MSMKYQLPTGQWIYFCAQIKKQKIDSSGTGGNNNVANVLTQAKMAIDHPIFDPNANRKVLPKDLSGNQWLHCITGGESATHQQQQH
jgi:hypothetical protein